MIRALPLIALALLVVPCGAHAGKELPVPPPEPQETTPMPPKGPLDLGDHGTFVHAEFGFETTEGDSCRAFLDDRHLTTTNRVWSGHDCAYPEGRHTLEITPDELQAFVELVARFAARATFTPNDTPTVAPPAQDFTTRREVRTTLGSLDFGSERNAWELDDHLLTLQRAAAARAKTPHD